MTTLLIDIDTQRDFCDADGALFIPGADDPAVRDAQRRLVAMARAAGWRRIATADDHQLFDPEIAVPGEREPDFVTIFPPHCLRATAGAERIPETALEQPLILASVPPTAAQLSRALEHHSEALVLKTSFSAWENPLFGQVFEAIAPEKVVVFGVATDICVAAMIDGLLLRGHRPILCLEACAGLDANRTADLLVGWQAAGVEIATVESLTP